MPQHANGFAIVGIANSAGSAFGRFLYLPPRLQDLPAGYITTVAGIGTYGGEYGPATEAWFPLSIGMAIDPSGRLYFTDTNNNRVLRIRTDGTLEPFAGNGHGGGQNPPGKMAALDASITFPRSIAFDSHGRLIVPDDQGYLWRVDPNGEAEVIAGTGQGRTVTPLPEGIPALGATIGQPAWVAVDAGDNIYFLDWTNARVRRIDTNGLLTTFAGNGTFGFSGDGGPATSAQFSELSNDDGGLAFDHAGNLLLVDKANHRIRRIDRAARTIDTIVGPSINGLTLNDLRGIAVGSADEIYFSNAAGLYVRTADGTISTLSSGKPGFSPDGARLPDAPLGEIYALLVDRSGNLLYSDANVARLRKIDLTTKQISTLAGSGPRVFGEGDSALAAAASTNGLAILPTGELVMSWWIGTGGLFKIDAQGRLIRIAGSGVFGPLFDVPALEATIASNSVSVARDGTIDVGGIWMARIDSTGFVRHTAAVPGACGFSGDGGPAVNASTCQAWDAIRDPAGNLVIADTNNNRIRRVDASTGMITTIVGSGVPNGFERYGAGTSCGDGGPATSACINTPYGVTYDDAGNLLICEAPGVGTGIRRVDRSGTISTLARFGCTKLTWAFGNLFTVAGYVARVSRSGEITALSPRGDGFSGDGGPAALAHIEANTQGTGIAVDAEGNLFFSDGNNFRVRAIRYGAVLAPSGSTIQATASGSTIRAVVSTSAGRPAEGVRVEFAPPSGGASCILSSPFAITDANGVASVSCTSNCVPGTYSVTASPLTASSTASVSFTNGGGPCRRRAARH